MDFTKAIEENRAALLADLQEALRINSVMGEPEPGMPFGPGPAKALQAMLDLGTRLGGTAQNFDNYAGHIDFGEGEETLGILGHVDVVPAGDGWVCDPFSGEVIDGKLYGRGIIDDKGPTIVCLYAIKILRELGLPLRRKIRVILGANEETNWDCVDHYFNTLKMPQPDLAFTPDAEFPVTYAEKGILQYTLSLPCAGDWGLAGGNAFNSVAESAQVRLPAACQEALAASCAAVEQKTGCQCSIQPQDGALLLTVQGKSAHAARLEGGINAISCLMAVLQPLELPAELAAVRDFYCAKIGLALYGENLGITCRDDISGPSTFNVGQMQMENGQVVFSIDQRLPVIADMEQYQEKLAAALEGTPARLEISSVTPALYIPQDHFLVKTLMEVYKDVTGDTNAQPLVDGGATYARACQNCVAFGALLPDQENLMHYKNEHICLDKLDQWLAIYLEAIYRLAK